MATGEKTSTVPSILPATDFKKEQEHRFYESIWFIIDQIICLAKQLSLPAGSSSASHPQEKINILDHEIKHEIKKDTNKSSKKIHKDISAHNRMTYHYSNKLQLNILFFKINLYSYNIPTKTKLKFFEIADSILANHKQSDLKSSINKLICAVQENNDLCTNLNRQNKNLNNRPSFFTRFRTGLILDQHLMKSFEIIQKTKKIIIEKYNSATKKDDLTLCIRSLKKINCVITLVIATNSIKNTLHNDFKLQMYENMRLINEMQQRLNKTSPEIKTVGLGASIN